MSITKGDGALDRIRRTAYYLPVYFPVFITQEGKCLSVRSTEGQKARSNGNIRQLLCKECNLWKHLLMAAKLLV